MEAGGSGITIEWWIISLGISKMPNTSIPFFAIHEYKKKPFESDKPNSIHTFTRKMDYTFY